MQPWRRCIPKLICKYLKLICKYLKLRHNVVSVSKSVNLSVKLSTKQFFNMWPFQNDPVTFLFTIPQNEDPFSCFVIEKQLMQFFSVLESICIIFILKWYWNLKLDGSKKPWCHWGPPVTPWIRMQDLIFQIILAHYNTMYIYPSTSLQRTSSRSLWWN